MTSLPRFPRRLIPFVFLLALSGLLAASPSGAACPPGHANPITSGSLLASAWLVNLGDLDGDGIPEYRVEAPGEGPGGWGDPRTVGFPSTLVPPRPPLVLEIRHEREDLDGDGLFDIFEDINRNGRLDPGEDRDGDGRLTPPVGCEGEAREDVDCDGHVDRFYEDYNGNGLLDPGEDLDGDRRLDLISEDLNFNGILDPGEDHNFNDRLDLGPYIEDRNGDQVLNDRPLPRSDNVIYEYFPDGTRAQLPASYPYGSFVPARRGTMKRRSGPVAGRTAGQACREPRRFCPDSLLFKRSRRSSSSLPGWAARPPA